MVIMFKQISHDMLHQQIMVKVTSRLFYKIYHQPWKRTRLHCYYQLQSRPFEYYVKASFFHGQKMHIKLVWKNILNATEILYWVYHNRPRGNWIYISKTNYLKASKCHCCTSWISISASTSKTQWEVWFLFLGVQYILKKSFCLLIIIYRLFRYLLYMKFAIESIIYDLCSI